MNRVSVMSNSNGTKPAARPGQRVLIQSPAVTGTQARFLQRTRWSEWVRDLARRWGRGVERNRLEMILLRPLSVTRHLRERWLLKSQQFSPRINLSLQVFFGATAPGGFADGSRGLVDRRFQAAERVFASDHGTRQGIAGLGPASYRTVSGESDALAGNKMILNRIELITPLERVFDRSTSRMQPREIARRVRIDSTLERLTRQAHRIESSFSSSSTATARPLISYSVNQAKALSAANDKTETVSQIPGFDKFSQSRMNREPGWDPGQVSRSGPEINIERITDQVIKQLDRRVVAARERVGRTF